MALPLAGEPIGIQEKVETIQYAPGVQDTGDLEAATKAITAIAEATGIGNADYSQALTLPKPDDARLVVKRIGARLAVTIDSMTAGALYCRVYVDAQLAANRLFDLSWTTTGAKLSATALTSGTIFDLLSDGAAHTFYFFFWVDAGNAVISVCQLGEAVGTGGDTDWAEVAYLSYQGHVGTTAAISKQGTGSTFIAISHIASQGMGAQLPYDTDRTRIPSAVVYDLAVWARSTVATDLVVLSSWHTVLRRLI